MVPSLSLPTKKTSKKILIIDDNSIILNSLTNLISTTLDKHKIKADIITGNDGLDLIREVIEDHKLGNKLLCCFVDENMEYIGGAQAVSIIRNLENQKKLTKIKICGISSVEMENNNNNFDINMPKPLNVGDVEKVLKEFGIITK